MAIFNNPGNVEGSDWAGVTGEGYGENNRFPVFDSPEMGVRAMMRDIGTKIKRHDGNIDAIISQYAPPNENDTEAYIKFVQNTVGKKKVALSDLKEMASAIITYENTPETASYYTQPEIMDAGFELAQQSFPASTSFEEAKQEIGYKESEGAPAPSGEDVGSIEALPDSYSHKIGDFFAGLMGGDQPTRNRRTQTISGLTDWSTEKPQELNTGGMVGMMTPTLEVIVGHDEESGNPIPAGSTDKEVRDDVEALLSEGEYVLPADVVRWHGLKHIQEMRDEAKCGLMCMSMDGQIKTPESDEAYEEPSDDEDVEVTEEGNEIEIVDNTDEKKIKAADGGLIEGSTEEGDTEEPASLGYLVRRLVRGPSGRMEVRYFDPETGMYVDDPTGYEVLDQNAYNSLNGAGMKVSGDDSGDDTAAEEVIDEAGSTSGDREDRYTLPEEPNTQVERNMATDYGFEDPNKLVTMGAGLLGGPLIGGAVRFGQSYNNAEAVDAAREDLGMEGLSWWDKVKGGFSGKYNNGAIGRDAIGENDYTAGFGGRVYEDEHGNDITTLTPNEWKKRTEAQNIDISTLPSAFDSEGTQTHTPPASSEQSDPWEGYGEAMQAKNDYLLGLAQEDGEKTTERSGFMSHFENPTAHKMFGKSYSDLTDDEKMATALRSQIDMGTANMAQGRQYEEIMARIDATNSASRTSSTRTGDSGGGIMTSQVTPHVSDTTPEIAPMPTWEDEVEMDTDFSWWDDTDTDDVIVSTAPHAEISGGNSINPVDPANEYYADLYGEEGRSTPGFLSPIDEIDLQEEMFLRDVRENDLPPAPSNDSDNSSSSSSSNSSSSKDRDNNSSSSSSGGGWTQPTKPAEEDDTPSYTYDSSGRVGYGYGL